ncbi:MAG: HAMP domain-containing methyl-accepting chemotaxis protein [Thermoanaerobaculia bacterium]
MTLGQKIIGGYVAILILLLVVAAVSFYAIGDVEQRYGGFLDDEVAAMVAAQSLAEETDEQILEYRGLLLYPEQTAQFETDLRASHRRFNEQLARVRDLSQSGEARDVLTEMERTHTELETVQERAIRLIQAGDREAARALGDTTIPLSRGMRGLTDAFIEAERKQLAAERERVRAAINRTFFILALISALAVLLGLGGGLLLTRSITGQLRATIAQLSAASAQILATTSQVASGAAETATSVSETTATVEEVKQTAEMSSQKARLVSDSAQKASQVSFAGKKSVDGTVRDMELIQTQMESVAESIVRLSEQSQSIGDIIATVTDLAEQSNLLAVNAAIEAARAGEQGKGFAVVAQEVKSLADQSRQATAQVRSILGEIQKATTAAVLATEQGNKAVETGVSQSAQAGEAIRQLTDSITEAAHAATQIAASSQQQMVGMDQVAVAMDNIKQASLQNVAGTRQAETAAQNLHELGTRLSALIGKRAE